ncbi:50S ribosomal protein L28 [Spirochaeta cellobiosiphila]|uniref:50S ribosomal protein L28 n=1 Tax=Spirochaeta cellobiosiphila TaxID=504483 RepID=UPI0003F4AD1F|nr:50S ribosomal protein L28 [Spirochaeta cellobiosiphila]
MARKCDLCGKGTVFGNNVPRKGLPKKKGGAGQNEGVKTRRTFKPNLVQVKTTIGSTKKTIKVCTRCLKAGKVAKAL